MWYNMRMDKSKINSAREIERRLFPRLFEQHQSDVERFGCHTVVSSDGELVDDYDLNADND